MPIPVAGAVSVAHGIVSIVGGGRTPVPTAISRVEESLRAAAQAGDTRRLLTIAEGGTVDLPYPNSSNRGWTTPINWNDGKAERAQERATARQLYASLTGSANPSPTMSQIPGISAIASHTDAAGGGVGDAISRAAQAAIAAGRADLLRTINAQEGNIPDDSRARNASGGMSLMTIVIIAVVVILLLRRK